jgi:hypothetical protein
VRRALAKAIDRLTVVSESDVTLSVLVHDTPVDFVSYPYPTLEPPLSGSYGCKLASLNDLVVMKLSAAAKRGIRRDFWDLHEILTSTPLTLSEALRLYRKRFGLEEADTYHVLRTVGAVAGRLLG